MRKALIESTEIEAGKNRIIAYGGLNYQTDIKTSLVNLTDWPTLEGEKCLKEDVYYSTIPIKGKHFICKYLTNAGKQEHLKIEKIKLIRDNLLDEYGWVHDRQYGEQFGIDHSIPDATLTITISEYGSFLSWCNELKSLTSTANLPALKTTISTISIDDITAENTSIFPVLTVDLKRPNGA